MDVPVAVLGFCTAFASTVWAMAGWGSWKAKHWAQATAFGTLILANLISTSILVSQLVHRPFGIPPWGSTLLLVLLIAVPPGLQLRALIVARSVVGRSEASG